MNDDQPTVEQSLHSIALSLIGIHKELKDTRRIQKDALRNTKEQVRHVDRRFARAQMNRTWWRRLTEWIGRPLAPISSLR